MKTTFIYALCEPGTRKVRYIGKTGRPKIRLREHMKDSKKFDSHLGHWLKLLASQGSVPGMLILREVEGDGSDSEIRYIRICRGLGIRLVNSTTGGDGCPDPSPETRKKMVESHLGSKNYNFGKPMPEKQKALISVKNSGKIASVEARANMRAAKLGVRRSPEACAAVSAGMVGRIVSEKTRGLISEALTGKVQSEQHRLANSEAHKGKGVGPDNPFFGKTHTATSRERISAGRIAGIARRKQQAQEIEWALAPYTLE